MKVRLALLSTAILAFGLATRPAMADVTPGETIDKTNYQKIEGLVPDFVLEWVKTGDLPMKIGKLSYDAKEFWSSEILETRQANSQRYTVDDHNGIIDLTTGKPARGIKGLPFPLVDASDPKLPMKIMWNTQWVQYFVPGNLRELQMWLSISRGGGLEKTLHCENLQMLLDPEKSQYDYAQLTVFRQPFNLAGTGSLAIYALYPLTDGVRFAYAAELRRVKRLSHRLAGSDTMFGLDAAPDDSWAGGPKTNMEEGKYRFIAERDALVPYYSEDPLTVEWSPKGEIELGNPGTGISLNPGFETPGWTGAPWHYTNVVWVKRRVYVIESESTNPNYAYGPCEGWIEVGNFSNAYKRITDKNGKLWKGSYWVALGYGTRDGKYRMVDDICQIVVDVRRDHGSAYPLSWRKGGRKTNKVQDMNPSLFTETGFSQYSQ